MTERRGSSEYSKSGSDRSSTCVVQTKFTKEDNKKGRGKVYALLLTDPYAIAGLLPTLASGAFPIITFYFLGNVITLMGQYTMNIIGDPMKDITKQLIYFSIVIVIVSILRAISSMFWIRVGSRISTRIRSEVFRGIMTYDVKFYDTHPIGALLTVLGEDTSVIQECFGTTKCLQLQLFGQFLIGLIWVLCLSWRLGLIMFALVPVVVIIMLIFHPFIHKNAIARFRNFSNAITIAEETIAAIRTIRGFNREEEETKRFVAKNEEAAHYERNIVYLIGTMFFVVFVLVWAVVIGNLYYASTIVGTKENGRNFDPGMMFSVFGMTMMGCMGLVFFENSIQAEQRAVTAANRVVKLLDYQPDINFNGGIQYDDFKGHIKFQNVSFCYPTRNVMALNNVSFEIKPNEQIALVGHSGSGKSTCVQLIERYYDVTEGIITIDGHDIKEIDPHWLHRKIALVSQEPTLFQASVRDNVTYGVVEKKTDEEVWAALEIANAKKFVTKFDNQLGQMVGDRGSTVSGGQKQRIAIARAVIKDPTILICDEATSALDAESEKKVQAALDKILETRTGVIVAHRLSTIKNATRIYVFDAGQIVEIGNHEELVEKKGHYWNLVKRQMKKAEDEEKKKAEAEHKKEENTKPAEEKPKEEPKKEEKPKEKKDKDDKEELSELSGSYYSSSYYYSDTESKK